MVRSKSKSMLMAAVVGLSALANAPAIWANPISWVPPIAGSGGSVTWATGANWVGGTAPANDLLTDTALFNQTTYNFQPNAGTTSVSGLVAGDSTTATAALTLAGTQLTLGANGIQVNPAAGAVTISSPLLIGASQNWTNNASTLLNITAPTISNTTNTAPFTIAMNGSGTGGTAIGGIISDAGPTGTTAMYVNTTGGATTVSGVNTFTGGVTLNAGTLNLNSVSALGATASNFVINGGTINNSTAAGITLTANNAQTWAGDFAFTGTQSLTFGSGAVAITPGATRTVTVNGSTLTIPGNISGAGATLVKAGSGALTINGIIATTTGGLTVNGGSLTLGGTNTYTGTTKVLGGTITINNTAALGGATSDVLVGDTSGTIAAGLTLGSQSLARNITIQSGNTGVITLSAGGTSGKGFTGTITLGTAGGVGHGVTLAGGNLSGFLAPIMDSATMQSGTGGVVTISLGGGTTMYFGNSTSNYSGGTVINGASGSSLSFGNGGFGPADPFGTGGGTITINSGVTFNQVGSQATLTGSNKQIWNGDWSDGNLFLYFNMTGAIDLGATGSSATRTLTIGTATSIAGPIGNGSNGITNSLTKAGGSPLTLTGANTYTGGTIINGGTLQFNSGAAPSTGLITINSGGALNATGALGTVTAWLAKIAVGSTGAIGLTGNSSESINFSTGGYNTLMLGATAASTYTGTLTPAGTTYRLGGGGSTLTLSSANALSDATGPISRSLVVGTVATAASGASSGTVALSNSDSFTGTTTVNAGTLSLTAATANTYGAIASSAVTLNTGTTLAIDTANATVVASSVTRASSLALNTATLTVTSSGVGNTNDVITGAININSGLNTITLIPNGTTPKNSELSAASLTRTAGVGTVLVRGVGFGTNSIASLTANSSNVVLGTTPTFVGSTGTTGTTMQIIPWAIGDSTAAGTGSDFLTYDSTYGLRRLGSTEEIATFATGNSTQDNAKVITAITGITTATSLNSLVLGTGGSVNGAAGTLSIASGGILSTGATTGIGNTASGTLAFGANEGVITTVSGSTLTIGSVITGTAGLSKNGSGQLNLTVANTYTGTTYMNAGTLTNNGVSASGITGTGPLVINGGAINQSASGGTVTLTLNNSSETWAGDFSLSNGGGGSTTLNMNGAVTLAGNRIVSVSGNAGVGSSLNINGAIGDGSNGYGVTWSGGGGARLNLNNNSTYSGATTVLANNICLSANVPSGAASAFGSATSSILFGATTGTTGAALLSSNSSGTVTISRGIVVQSGGTGGLTIGNQGGDQNESGTIALAGNLTLGTGTTGRSISLIRATVTGNIVDPAGLAGSPGLITVGVLSGANGNYPSAFAVTLSGNNTFSGGVTLTEGSANAITSALNINSATALGTGTLTISTPNTGGTVKIDNTSGGAITLTNNNLETWNGDFTFGGTNALNMGTGAVTLGSNRNVTVSASTLTVGGVIGDGGHGYVLQKMGNGTLLLTGVNTYSGATGVYGGVLSTNLLANGGVASGIGQSSNAAVNLVINGGTLQYTGPAVTIDRNYSFGAASGGGSGKIDASGSGALTITGNMTNLATTGTAQPLTLLGSNTGNNTLSGAIVDGGGTAVTSVTKSGTGTWVLSGNNTYTGGMTVSGGTLVAASSTALGTVASALSLGGSTLDLAVDSGLPAYNTTITATSTILSDKATASSAGITQTLGTLSIGAVTLNVSAGANVSGGSPAIVFGATTLSSTGSATTLLNPTTASVTLGSVTSLAASTKTDTLQLDGTAAGNAITGVISNGATGTVAVSKTNTSVWTFSGANTYSGTTTINAGALNFSTFTGSSANSDVTLGTGLTLAIDSNSGTPVASVTRAKSLTLANNGTVTVAGTSAGNTNDVITNSLTLAAGSNTITISPNTIPTATTSATLTVGTLARTSPAVGFVNGANLGMDSSSVAGVARMMINNTPTLVGTTTALNTGVNAAAKNTQIVPYLVGEAAVASGGTGSASGIANTFLTWNSSTGLRPLNLTDEFTPNAIVAGNNTYITTGATVSSTTSINSLVMAGGTLTINNGITLTNTSGAILFTGNGTISTPTSGAVTNGTENIVTVDSGFTGTIGNVFGGGGSIMSGNITKAGAGTLALAHEATTGNTTVLAGTLALTAFSTFNDGGFVTGAAGTTIDYSNDGGTQTDQIAGLNTAGSVKLGSWSLSIASNNSSVGGVMSGTGGFNFGGGYGGTLTLSSANTYTGVTTISGGTTVSTLKLNTVNAIAYSSQVNIGGILDLAGFNQSIVALAGAGTVTSSNSGAVTLTIAGGTSQNFSGIIQNGSGTVSVNNSAGTQILSGASTYTGTTTISGGILSVNTIKAVGSASSALGAPTTVANGTIAIGSASSGGTLLYTGSGNTTDRVISLAGTTGGATLDQSGTGLLKFTSNLTAPGTAASDNRKTLTLQGSTAGTGEISGAIVDSTLGIAGQLATSVAKTGTGAWTLSGVNTYTGPTTINGGTLGVAADTALGNISSAVTINGGTLDATTGFSTTRTIILGTGSPTVQVDSGTETLSTALSGSSLSKAGSGSLILNASATYTGGTAIQAGTIQLGVTDALPTATTVTLSTASTTGTLDLNGQSQTLTGLALGSGATNGVIGNSSSSNATLVYAGGTSIFGGVIQDTLGSGSQKTALTVSSGTLRLAVANTFSGATTLNGGTLTVGADSALGTSAVTINNATLDITTGFTTSRSITLGTGSPTIKVDAGTQVLNTAFSGTGSLSKAGSGQLDVATLPSAVGVAGGILQLTAAGSTHTLETLGSLTISGGTLDLTNHDLFISGAAGSVSSLAGKISSSGTNPTILSTTTIAVMSGSEYMALGKTTLGSGPSLTNVSGGDLVGVLAYGGDANLDGKISADDYLALNLGYMFHLSGWTHGDFDQDGTIGVGDFAVIDNNFLHQSGSVADGEIALHTQWFGAAYTDAFNALNAPAAVPEPASLVLLGLGTLSLLKRRR